MFDEIPPVRLPLVVEIAPFMVNVFAPMESAPLVRVRVPPTVTAPPREIPLLRLTVRLLRVNSREGGAGP